MATPAFEAIVLGVLQGITEFLPISSDGHLAIAQKLFGHEADLFTTVILHAGTLAATLLVLRKRVGETLRGFFRAARSPALLRTTPEGHDILVIVAASIPTALIGLTLKHRVEIWSNSLFVIGLCLFLSGVVLLSTKFIEAGSKLSPTLLGAATIGVLQGSAVLPGLSRSAMTIAGLLWLGIRSDRAFEYSFLLSLPAVGGALLLESRKLGGAMSSGPDGASLILGVAVSFIVGVGSLLLLKRVLSSGRVSFFALYLFPVAFAVLAWAYASP